jgi:hypothetical protein
MSREVQAGYSIRAWPYEVQDQILSHRMYFPTRCDYEALSASLVGRFFWSRGFLSALASSTVARTEKSQEMWVMRLTRKGHHRKLRAPIRDISDWLVNADVSDFCRPPTVS